MCFFKVTNFIADGISQHGVARNLEHICSKVFLKEKMLATFGMIRRQSADHAVLPCLLLFCQDPFLARRFVFSVSLATLLCCLCLFVIYVHMIALLAC